MDSRLIVLELVLAELGLDTSIETIDNRVLLQKAIYLSQIAGVPLGYRFSWYVMGPYSPSLTRDYYSLEVVHEEESEISSGRRLKNRFKSILRNLKPILSPPEEVNLRQSTWLELVSSVHYLRTVSGYGKSQARKRLQVLKPHLYRYAHQAEDKLKVVGLL